MHERRLIINADDYGLCDEINAAVAALDATGLLGGVSLLVNGAACAAACAYARQHPQLAAGIHFNAVEGRALTKAEGITNAAGFLPRGWLMKRWLAYPQAVSNAVEREWRAQIEALLAAGLKLSHADSHQHLHAFPPAFECAVRLCHEYGIPALRLPHEALRDHLRWAGLLGLRVSLRLARWATPARALRHNDHFLGFRHAGHFTLETLRDELAALPAGLTELAVHPSMRDGVPYPDYASGQELAALLAPDFRACLTALQIKIVSWA